MAIEKLPINNSASASTYIAISLNGQDMRIQPSVLEAYLSTIRTQVGIKTTQYSAPAATGFSVQITDTGNDIWLVLTPLAGYAAGTIVLPALTNAKDKQEVLINSTQAVAALTVNGNGAAVVGAPTALIANEFFLLRFEAVLNTWYRVG